MIPDVDLNPLANRLSATSGVTVAQHGVDHENKLPPGGPRSEFPVDASQAAVNAAVAAGRARMVAAGLPPITFVPPWNEPSDRQIEAIRSARYDSYSIRTPQANRSEALKHVGAQVDILRWKGKPHFKGRRACSTQCAGSSKRAARWELTNPSASSRTISFGDEAAWRSLTGLSLTRAIASGGGA